MRILSGECETWDEIFPLLFLILIFNAGSVLFCHKGLTHSNFWFLFLVISNIQFVRIFEYCWRRYPEIFNDTQGKLSIFTKFNEKRSKSFASATKAWVSKILWFSSLLEGNLPSSKDENQSILQTQALKEKIVIVYNVARQCAHIRWASQFGSAIWDTAHWPQSCLGPRVM